MPKELRHVKIYSQLLQMILMLPSMQCDGSLWRGGGSITIVAKRFDMACSTVY